MTDKRSEKQKIIDWLRSTEAGETLEMRRLLIAHEDSLARDIAIGMGVREELANAIERGAHL